MKKSKIALARGSLHRRVLREGVLGYRINASTRAVTSVINVADSDNKGSKAVASAFAEKVRAGARVKSIRAQSVKEPGKRLEYLVRDYLIKCFAILHGSGSGWSVEVGHEISDAVQYRHLRDLKQLVEAEDELRIAVGGDYFIQPDILVLGPPMEDVDFGPGVINSRDGVARATDLRRVNHDPALPLLHASVSCKWTLRSDRAQNSRTEAQNMIRHRKGRVPAIAVVTVEPMPSRIASLAEGTGDIDRVYHLGLYELQSAIRECRAANPKVATGWEADLHRLVAGKRLADISDLPFDLIT